MTIESAFKDLGSFFYSNEKFANQVSGKLIPNNNSVLNIYTKGGNGVIEYPYKQEDLESLYQFASEARFGRQHEDVLDPTYRKAKTLTNDLFAMNLMPGSGTLHEINRFLGGTLNGAYMLEAELYRLNIYKEGDFFREHMDTPQTEQPGHIGSLVMFLPTEYEGGELVIKNSSLDDHTTYAFGQEKGGNVNWVAFFPDAEHSVQPVTSGYRLTLTFHLYQQKAPEISTALSYHGQNPVIQKVRSIMQDMEQVDTFRDRYDAIYFKLTHSYPMGLKSYAADIVLKGSDAALMDLLKDLNLEPEIVIYSFPKWLSDDDNRSKEKRTYYSYKVDVTRNRYVDDQESCDERSLHEMASEVFNGIAEKGFWVARGFQRKVMSIGAAYGNEPSTKIYYGNFGIRIAI